MVESAIITLHLAALLSITVMMALSQCGFVAVMDNGLEKLQPVNVSYPPINIRPHYPPPGP